MRNKDIRIIEKVYENVESYDWEVLSPGEEYFSKIDFPMDARRDNNIYYSEVQEGLIIITGTYQSRFYYEEDNFTWDKQFFAAIISDKNNYPSSIAFINNEVCKNQIVEKSIFNMTKNAVKDFENRKHNIIIELYDTVNRKVSGADELYDDFLRD